MNNSDSGDVNIQSGDTVSLVFDSHADDDQEPINSIRIIWETDNDSDDFERTESMTDPWEAAASYDHTYTYTYTCDPTSDATYDEDLGACQYYVKIQVEDNWEFCSGDSQATGTGDVVRSTEDICTSFDAYDGVINVYP